MGSWTTLCLLILVTQLWRYNNVAEARSTGADPAACDTMVPDHYGTVPQTSTAPFQITGATAYTPGQDVTLKLQALESEGFKGFLVQARTVDGERRVGTFLTLVDEANHKYMCDQEATTHVNPDEKFSVNLKWRAPSPGVGDIRFRATVVRSFSTYWTEIYSDVIPEFAVASTLGVTPSTTTATTAAVASRHETTTRRQTVAMNTGTPHTTRMFSANRTSLTNRPQSTTTTSEMPQGIQVDLSECGVNKGCFRYPGNCHGAECEMVATWTRPRSGETSVMFELQGKSDGWVALGFSDDGSMGDDYVLLCVNEVLSGQVTIKSSYNVEDLFGRRNQPFDDEHYGLSDAATSNVDGVMTCVFRREIDATSVDGEEDDRFFDITNEYTLFLGTGPALAGRALKHEDLPQISERAISVTSDIGDPGIIPPPPMASGATTLAFSFTLCLLFFVLAFH